MNLRWESEVDTWSAPVRLHCHRAHALLLLYNPSGHLVRGGECKNGHLVRLPANAALNFNVLADSWSVLVLINTLAATYNTYYLLYLLQTGRVSKKSNSSKKHTMTNHLIVDFLHQHQRSNHPVAAVRCRHSSDVRRCT
eukprot:scaffold3556_cov129-Skeletonema_marinoi.AAC.4